MTVLANGNYVVVSENWDNGAIVDAGAITFGNGATGIIGGVSSTNSLVGTSTFDRIGFPAGAVTVLADGNYVVKSWDWDAADGHSDVGAVTWGSGTLGVIGPVSATNSLVGSQSGDRIGTGVAALANGSYLVMSRFWSVGLGAATWCSDGGGCRGDLPSNITLRGRAEGDFENAYAIPLAMAMPRFRPRCGTARMVVPTSVR